MMDAKYLAEIKARTGRAKFTGDFGLQQFYDLDALIAEVERLNEVISSMDDMHIRIMQAKEHELNHVLVERNAYIAQNATLEKALEIAAELYGKATGDTWNPESTVHDFIFMAEHPEKAQEHEGKNNARE